ncbi:MAG: hypothetical protein ACP5N1_06170 [Candidatus Woesearchaeota archaeon]
MSTTCIKCGVKISYGFLCGKCNLKSDITNTLFENSNNSYNISLVGGNYFQNNTNFDRTAKESALKKYLMDNRYSVTFTKNPAITSDKFYELNLNGLTIENLDAKLSDYKIDLNSKKLDYVITISKDDNSSNYIININVVPISESYKKLNDTNGKYVVDKYSLDDVKKYIAARDTKDSKSFEDSKSSSK